MDKWPKIVESFPLTVKDLWQLYTRIPADASDIFYHYTTHNGLTGILRSGGLRATSRMRMNDNGEFEYARKLIYEELNEVGRCLEPVSVVRSLTTYTRKNLDQFLRDTTEMSRAYCACLTISPDHPGQWETYADSGKGFVLGFDLRQLLNMQIAASQRGDPCICCAPVIYKEDDQRDLIWRLVKAGIDDLHTFAKTCSQQSEHLTALRDRITKEIVVQLITLIDFIKAPAFNSEREMRLVLNPNDGTLKAPHIQHYQCDNESMPFIFMDLRSPKTSRLPLAEIKIGPKASFPEEKAFLEDLLDELGYGSNYRDRPRITQSAVALIGRP